MSKITTIYLNTAYSTCVKTTRTSPFLKSSAPDVYYNYNTTYTFDIPQIEINNGSKLRVKSIIHNNYTSGNSISGVDNSQFIFKIKNIYVNSSSYWGNDDNNSYPTILMFDSKQQSYFMPFDIELTKQSIQEITLIGTAVDATSLISSISYNKDLTNINNGILDIFNFCIVLEIEDA